MFTADAELNIQSYMASLQELQGNKKGSSYQMHDPERYKKRFLTDLKFTIMSLSYQSSYLLLAK